MNEDDQAFLSRIRRAYTPGEMTGEDVKRFDEKLSDGLSDGQGQTQSVRWVLAAAVVLMGVMAVLATEDVSSTAEPAVERHIAQHNEPVEPSEPWPTEADISALGFDSIEEGDLLAVSEEDWLPDDYQALAMVIDFNQE